jgi:ATP adenylyltransferase
MIIPHRHLSRMEDLTSAEKAEIFDLIVYSVQALKESIRPDGFNIGMNLGRAAGAGIEDHLHVHVVPRWDGDTNFVSVVGDVRVIPEDVVKTWEQLRPYFKKYQQEA